MITLKYSCLCQIRVEMSHVWILQGLSTLIKPYFAAPRGKLFDTLHFLNAVHLLLRGWLFIPFQKILPSGLDIILSIRRPTEIQLDRNLRLKSKTYSNRPYRSRPLGLAFFVLSLKSPRKWILCLDDHPSLMLPGFP